MESTEAILDRAYAAQVAKLYAALFESVVSAEGDERAMDSAQQRFAEGLALALEALRRAKRAAAAH